MERNAAMSAFIAARYQACLSHLMTSELSLTGQGLQALPARLARLAAYERMMTPAELARAQAGALQDVNQVLANDRQRTMLGKPPQFVTSL
jgi:hypothetical protein